MYYTLLLLNYNYIFHTYYVQRPDTTTRVCHHIDDYESVITYHNKYDE